MSLILRKINAFAKKVANLPPTPGGTMPVADLQAQFDAAPEELRAAFNGALDDIIADYATKAELSGIQLGQLTDGTVTPAKLSFDPATQAELNALSAGMTFTGTVGFPSFAGQTQIKKGNADAASYTQHNLIFKGWNGLGMQSFDDSIQGYYDFRSGKWDVKTGYFVDGVPTATMTRGSYTGTGISRTISLGFTPKYAIITGQRSSGVTSLTAFHITPSRAISTYGTEHTLIKCVTNGIQLNDGDYANVNATTYDYVVWG